VSRGSGTTPEYAMHCESVPVQNCYKSRLAELWPKAGNSLAGRSAGHEHQAACNRIQRRAEVHYTYISRVESPQNVCRGSVEECSQAHAEVLVHTTRHKADRLVTGALKLLFLAICMCLSPQSGCEEAACKLISTERSHCKGSNPAALRVMVAKARSHVRRCIAGMQCRASNTKRWSIAWY